ncbi:ABC transporter ATP-binding protein [Rickettsia prowazekii]|nr:ABC transporter ATP-binding protein [Rickettsia prowazekii]EOB09752.1 Multidrug resistance protein [Rickettsia prowazekii str. GvF12]ADE29911.1 Multidrug resistance protein [Rickettsia prowazekii str. Rp22]AFE49201.1 lipid A export ATP-binding/permease protein MsbA [Rickettsia prowazekii str. Chernikova]AFE50047.1 lipid A export ATP-binding/permease protein MsbA [Rickettsia prowazekii str. Katsinyian]AFE50892.1 lipid A export ATP-binding/permease protein MsbA [Rickettsia prowazekii str. BuV
MNDNNLNDNYTVVYIIKRLIKDHVKPYAYKIYFSIFCMVIAALCTAVIVHAVRPIIDKIFLTHDKTMLVIMPIILTVTFFIKGISEYYQNYLIKFVGQMVLNDLKIKMYEHLLSADIAFIQKQSSGRLISRFTNDISLMRGAVSNLLVGCAKHFLTVVCLIITMFHLEPILSCVVFLVFPLAVYPVQRMGKKIRKIFAQSQEELGHYTSRLDETFQSIKIIKSFVGEKIESHRASLIMNNILEFYKRTSKLDAMVSPIMEGLSGIAVGGMVWYGGTLVLDGKTTPGALFAFLAAFAAAYRPFKSLVSLNINLQEGIAAAKRVFSILDTEPIIKDHENAKQIDLYNPQITFEKLTLNFDSKIAIKYIDLKLDSHKIIAFVGRSGSGKTSLSNLLVRFYDPSHGRILINNHDIKDIKLTALRRQISLVTQDTHLFDASVAENIAYGHANATREEIISAAQYADAHEFIMHLPNGYDTQIGVHGKTLSGGQRQRLSIARALLKDAPILIWDEATSNLDQASEQKILKFLKKLRQGKTTLIITHRLSSILDLDNIIVMKNGEICEQGTHTQLIQNKNEYYMLYNNELKENV